MNAVHVTANAPRSLSCHRRPRHPSRNRLLFILRQRQGYDGRALGPLSSGLRNSVTFVLDMLRRSGIDAQVEEAIDGNCIDRLLTKHRPTHCILEAFWVTPGKLAEVRRLHPDVQFMVRNHSEVPFLANEGIAFTWAAEYLRQGVEVMCNAPRALDDMKAIAKALRVSERLVTFGPNYYPIEHAGPIDPHVGGRGAVDIACFGAIRPLKNHMAQAIAALRFAYDLRRPLRFHINGSRPEGGGEQILKNLRALFAATPNAELVEHAWLPHREFVRLYERIDIALQVSFSETFNIVAADAVAASVPVVVSEEVPWIGDYAITDPESTEAIADALHQVWSDPNIDRRLWQQRHDLAEYSRSSREVWVERFA